MGTRAFRQYLTILSCHRPSDPIIDDLLLAVIVTLYDAPKFDIVLQFANLFSMGTRWLQDYTSKDTHDWCQN